MFPGLELGSSTRDPLDPNPALPQLLGGVCAPRGSLSTGIKSWRRRAASELFVGPCSTRNGILEPFWSGITRPGQPRTAGELPEVLLQPQLSPALPSAVHSSAERPEEHPAPKKTHPKGLKQPQTAPQAQPGAPDPPEARRQLQVCPKDPVGSLRFIQRETPGAAFP